MPEVVRGRGVDAIDDRSFRGYSSYWVGRVV